MPYQESRYADDLVEIAESKEELIKKLTQWKNGMEGKGIK